MSKIKKAAGAVMSWWHRHPVIKSTIVTVAGGGIGAVVKVTLTAGPVAAITPQALLVAFAGGVLAAGYGLAVKRPQDGKAQVVAAAIAAAQAKLAAGQAEPATPAVDPAAPAPTPAS